jgi:ABC-2 type transport system permease protein
VSAGDRMTSGDARILDRGFTRYTGERTGTAAAIRTLTLHTVQRLLGLRRSFRHKLLPLLVLLIAYLPAVAFLGLAVLLPEQLRDAVLPTQGDVFGAVTTATLLFVALVSPEALCPDRRHRTLGLYLASPLDRRTYLVSKAAAVGGVLLLVTLGPPLLVEVGYLLLGVVDLGWASLRNILEVIAVGVAVSLTYTLLGLAGASLTERRGFATVGIVVTLLLLASVTGILVQGLDAPEWVRLLNVVEMIGELARRVHGERGPLGHLATPVVVAGWAVWTVGLAVFVDRRAARFEVVR